MRIESKVKHNFVKIILSLYWFDIVQFEGDPKQSCPNATTLKILRAVVALVRATTALVRAITALVRATTALRIFSVGIDKFLIKSIIRLKVAMALNRA